MKLGDKEIIKDGKNSFQVYNYAELRLIIDGEELSLFFTAIGAEFFLSSTGELLIREENIDNLKQIEEVQTVTGSLKKDLEKYLNFRLSLLKKYHI